MERHCIYCGNSNDLSKSDIIPDALTNAKIINPNVCRVEHNNKFSDLFEDEVIKKLAFITNILDVKSKKSKTHAMYPLQINIDGIDYSTKIVNESDVFNNKIMRSTDGKYLIGPVDELLKISGATENNITPIDINNQMEQRINLDTSIYFSESIYRLVAKIAFEWFCLHNEVNGKKAEFEPIINFITNGVGNDFVSIVHNEELYDEIKKTAEFGSHTIISYINKDQSVNVLVSLFGIAIYNIKICDEINGHCKYDIIFNEFDLDSDRVEFKYGTFYKFQQELINKLLELGGFGVNEKGKHHVPLKYLLFLSVNYHFIQNKLQCSSVPNKTISNILLNNIQEIVNTSPLTTRSIKRFVKDQIKFMDNEFKLNPKQTNFKAIFNYYLLFLVGQSNGTINSLSDLNKELKHKFSGGTIGLNDKLSSKLLEEIFSEANYSEIIKNGALLIDNWRY